MFWAISSTIKNNCNRNSIHCSNQKIVQLIFPFSCKFILSIIFCSNDIPRKVWPRAKEVMQQRPSMLDFKESLDLQSSNTDKKFDLRDGKVEVWLFVASAIFGAVFSLMIFQLVRLLRLHCLVFKPDSCCHGEPQKAIDKVIHEGLKSVVKTKKVVVMNIHLIPCNADNCDQVQAKGMVLTKDYHHNCPKEIYHGKDPIHHV